MSIRLAVQVTSFGPEVYILDDKGGFVGPGGLIFTARHDPTMVIPSAFIANPEMLQGFMDELWALGFRPRSVAHEVPRLELDAAKAHLEDMRHIVYRLMGLPKPEDERGSAQLAEGKDERTW